MVLIQFHEVKLEGWIRAWSRLGLAQLVILLLSRHHHIPLRLLLGHRHLLMARVQVREHLIFVKSVAVCFFILNRPIVLRVECPLLIRLALSEVAGALHTDLCRHRLLNLFGLALRCGNVGPIGEQRRLALAAPIQIRLDAREGLLEVLQLVREFFGVVGLLLRAIGLPRASFEIFAVSLLPRWSGHVDDFHIHDLGLPGVLR